VPKIFSLRDLRMQIDRISMNYGLDYDTVSRLLEISISDALTYIFGYEVDAGIDDESETLSVVGYLRDDIGAIWEIREIPEAAITPNAFPLILSNFRKALVAAAERTAAARLYSSLVKDVCLGQVVSMPSPQYGVRVKLLRPMTNEYEEGILGVADWRNIPPHERAHTHLGDRKYWYISSVYTVMNHENVREARIKLSRTSINLPEKLMRHYLRLAGEDGNLALKCEKRILGAKSVIVTERRIPLEVIKAVSNELKEFIEIKIIKRL